ncbi:hypothetical protein PV773_18160 [Mesorhizobium sp. CC13]|uniref:hypothetical protein n=1 Tax=Mesorhizobium sp. CC13 TaxID=3029194 RepID=UPI0032667BED
MADSDHSMSLARVTRRVALTGWVVGATGWAFGRKASARSAATIDATADPALALWREWAAAHQRAQRLCRRQQELEAELAERVEVLWTVVKVPGGEEIVVCSKEALDRIVGARTDMAAIRARAEAELAERQACFEAAATEIGYFAGLRAEREAYERVEALLEALSQTPAVSLAGVVGKLDAVIRNGEAWEDLSAFPWPQIRSARDDLMQIGRQMTPHAIFPVG